MSDNSNFVLRWEIGNATAVHAAGKAESKVFNEGGFEWKIKMNRDEDDDANISLEWGLKQHRHWKCEGTVNVRLIRTNGKAATRKDENFLFNDDHALCRHHFKPDWAWNCLTSEHFNANDKVTWEFHIHIINSKRDRPIVCKFATPNNKSNVILKIGEEKLHVSKEYLAFHSPVFDALFFGDFAEKGKEEVEIKDVICEEFVDLLNVIYLENRDIRDGTVSHILKLADRFQMKGALNMSMKHLMQSKGVKTIQKLIMADEYRLADLRDHCLKSITSLAELNKTLKSSPETANFSDEMKIAIYDRNWQLMQ